MERALLHLTIAIGARLGGNMSIRNRSIQTIAKLALVFSVLAFSSASFASLGNVFDPSRVSDQVPVNDSDYSRLERVAQAVNSELTPNPRLQFDPSAGASAKEALQDLQMIYEQVIPPTGSNIWNCTAPACTGQ